MSTEEFISAIKSREIIWNTNHRSFNNRQQKQVLWDEIAEEFNISVDECKRKWKGLRTTLRQNIKPIDKDLPPGSRVFPKWRHIDDMSFLIPLMKTRSNGFANDKIFDEWSISCAENEIGASPSDPNSYANNLTGTIGNPISLLIEEVKQQQILWNEHDPNFECIELKDEGWSEIESRLSISAFICKKKWESILEYLAVECAKHPDNSSSWAYFKQLDFVQPFVQQGNRTTIMEQNNDSQKKSETKNDFPDRVIAEVKKYPLIWNLYSKNYKSVYKKLKAWRKIAHSLESTVEEVKKKWKALRDVFAKHYAKNPDENTNNWPYFKQMIFLAPYLKGNKLSFAKSFERTQESDDEESVSSVAWESDNNETKNQTPAVRETSKFSNEDFIEAVRKQQILWDSTFNNFKNNKLRCVVWKEVADYFGLPVIDCKKKWRTLRDLFVRTHLKPIREEDKSWKHYDQMKFLVPHLRERKNDPLDPSINSNSFDNSVEDLKIEVNPSFVSAAEETQNDEEKTAQVLDEQNINEFIRLVKRHDVLWNTTNKNYRNNEFRFQAWEDVSEHFSLSTIDDCRKRWKALRDNFSRHYYKPIREEDKSWKNYHDLKFLIPHLKYKKCANVLKSLPKTPDFIQKTEPDPEPENVIIKQEPVMEEDESMSSDFEDTSKNDNGLKTADKICSDEFIDVVKQHEMLWNTEDENYKNNELRTKEWELIAVHFETSVDECKKKWKALRDSFVRNYFKPIKEKYKSWNYYSKMKFLGPHVKYKKDKSLIGDPEFPRKDEEPSSPSEDETELNPKKFTVKEFVNEIKKHTILWDLSDERCRMRKYRLLAWKEISAHFSVSTLECKRKWATLRSAFIREFAKCPDNDTWGNFKELDFLLPYLKANVSANHELSASESTNCIPKDHLISCESNEVNSDNQFNMPNSQDDNWMEVFIQTIKQQKILWDTTDSNFKNALKRQQAWNSIAKDFGLSIDDSKQKWKTLRDTFANLYHNSQDGTEENSEWKYYNSMKFLCPHLKHKKLGEIGYEDNNDSDSCSAQAGNLHIQKTTANEKCTIKFIKSIKEKQLLWNWSDDDYNDTNKKEEAWGLIANKFGLPIARCKERWLALRNCYNRVILSQSNNPKHSWKYLEEMNFLKPFINVDTDSSLFVDVSGSLSFDDIIEEYSFPEEPMDDDQDDALYEELFECSPSEFSQNIEKIEIPKHHTPDRAAAAAKRRRCSEESSDDEDKEFFQVIKETMKQLPSDVKSDAKGHIKAYLKVIASNHNLWNFNLD
ncbi:uncharacterized protein LOC129939952 isoform X2 [Eupeodes corollae]|uniref:uncharacterized protein LOC129939952 isoform X2 n=1 Tax=Eupeodes corollae TaxID=290404 RepID=UPI00249055E7|nr:uncharacterized protein LOC129939952 isoform X2 [Eupeodes corollae]